MTFPSLNRLSRYAVLACAPLAFAACDDDDPNDDNLGVVDTIREALRVEDDYGELEDALDEYELIDRLDDASLSLTLFAPNNAAVEAAELDTIDGDVLGDALAYHVVNAELGVSDIGEGYTLTNTSLAGTGPDGADVSLVITNSGGMIAVNGIAVVDPNVDEVNNGFIHGISGVLFPPSITDFALALEDFSSLESAILAVDESDDFDIAGTLDGAGPFTVFAPVNSALMLPDSLSREQIGEVLQYHVVPGFIRAADVTDSTSVTTAAGAALTVAPGSDGGVTVTDEMGNTFNVVLADVVATNGVIHAIDGVLMPGDQ